MGGRGGERPQNFADNQTKKAGLIGATVPITQQSTPGTEKGKETR